jgi:hypothetical protein
MIRKIVSRGTDAAADAAREAATRLGLALDACAGPANSRESSSDDPEEAFRRGVVEADATVLLTQSGGGSRIESLQRICQHAGCPLLHLDLQQTGGFQAARQLSEWVEELEVECLHVAGLGTDSDPALARKFRDLLEAFFYLNLMHDNRPPAAPAPLFLEDDELPRTVAGAVKRLAKQLPLKDRTTIANMAEIELPSLDSTLGEYIRNAFRLWSGNYALLDSCRWIARKTGAGKTDAAAIIIQELWKELKKTHTLRVVK